MEGLIPLFVEHLFMNLGLGEQGVDGEESTKGILPSAAFTCHCLSSPSLCSSQDCPWGFL